MWTEAVVVPSWWFRFPQLHVEGSLCQSGSVTIDRSLGRTRRTTRESEMLMFLQQKEQEGGCCLSLQRAGCRKRSAGLKLRSQPSQKELEGQHPTSSSFPLTPASASHWLTHLEQVRSHGGQPPGQGWVENGWWVGKRWGGLLSLPTSARASLTQALQA